jgi:hypothetical protein
MAQDGNKWRAVVTAIMNLGVSKCWESLDKVRNCGLLKMGSSLVN